ncbi:MAG: MarR family winged helix-turn-helix transcriptional regulator [Pseudorhodoplanes sp.]
MDIAVDFAKVEKNTIAASRARDASNKHGYFAAVAHIRYIMRKVFRMIDEEAKKHKLDSLGHQALLQIYGSPKQALRVSELADRLDITPAFASNLVKGLIKRKFIKPTADSGDMRVKLLNITAAGRDICHQIDAGVRPHVDYFTSQLTIDEREAALSTLIFYIKPGPIKAR